MKVEILGTIVSPDYDDDIFDSWIRRGIVTPSSRVVASIADACEPIDLYINSFGGDVFAGGEMMIAILKANAEGKVRRCEVGSIAASMAANIVAALKASGASVVVHPNSQLMFHGCYATTEGGAQHHEDVAESLRNINDSVVANLNRIGVKECRAWFAEGRKKWISADKAVELGIADYIYGEDAVAPAEAKSTASRLAAFASSIKSRKEYSLMIDENTKPEEVPAVDDAPKAEDIPVAEVDYEEVAEPKEDEKVEAKAEEMVPMSRLAGLQAAKDKKISELEAKLSASATELEKANADLSAARARADKAEADLAEARAVADAERKARESVVTSALAPAEKLPTFQEGYAKCASLAERQKFINSGKFRI